MSDAKMAAEISKYVDALGLKLDEANWDALEAYLTIKLEAYAESRVREAVLTMSNNEGCAIAYKAGQEAMRERAARRACNGFDAEQIRSLPIEEKA